MLGLLVPLLVLLAIVLAVVAVMQRVMGKSPQKPGEGADIIPYLLLALAMGVAGFALADLASTAFPGERFVFDPASELATSLAALVVSVPFAVFFWRRQARRRLLHPSAVGWALYLSLMELVFLTAFVVSAVQFLDGLFSDGPLQAWTGTVVFGAMVVFHEIATDRTPPHTDSDAGELPRVLGSAIGWVTVVVGLAGTLGQGLLALAYESLTETIAVEWSPWVAIAVVGVAVWVYKWVRPWPGDLGVPRLSWATMVSIGSLSAALGWATAIGVLFIQYLFSEAAPAGEQFENLPMFAAIALVGLGSWLWHRRPLGEARSNALRAYEYAMSGIGLISSVSLAIALTVTVFEGDLIVGGDSGDVMSIAFSLVVAILVWRFFDGRWRRGEPEFEATAWPRRIHNLGLGILFGLVAAGSLITSIFVLLRRVLDGAGQGSLLTPAATLIFTGLAAWYLLAAYVRDRVYAEDEEVIAPFDVTIVTSHPGLVATRFPKQARLTVIHRGDDAGVIDDEMADSIVAEVANRPSLVWVDQDGFRVAPKRVD
jgi:Domain of unknown function (DUF5671)